MGGFWLLHFNLGFTNGSQQPQFLIRWFIASRLQRASDRLQHTALFVAVAFCFCLSLLLKPCQASKSICLWQKFSGYGVVAFRFFYETLKLLLRGECLFFSSQLLCDTVALFCGQCFAGHSNSVPVLK